MPELQGTMGVRQAADAIFLIDIRGDLTAAGEDALTRAYTEASEQGAHVIILNFAELDYMNSSGIGLLVTLLIRTNRQKQKLLTCGLSEHYKHIFELTRLTDAIAIYGTEAEALQAAGTP